LSENLKAEELKILIVESQPEIISKIHSLLSEIKECRLKVRSSHEGLTAELEELDIDLVFLSHEKNAIDEIVEIRERFPDTYVIALLPSFDEELINQYIGTAQGIVFKNENFENDLSATLKKALVKLIERKTLLASSLSQSSLLKGNRDMEMLLARQKALQPGQVLLHYKIVEGLGEGGMGEVYRAEDQKLRRPVAIKVLPPRIMSDSIMRKRLTREAIAASALNHPNIITIYAIEESTDLSFIVMEFVEGSSMFGLMNQNRLSFDQVLDIGLQVSDALSVAHAAGLIHRDIKPGNIMVSNRGRVKLLDFGLAKWMPQVEQEFSSDPLFTSNLTELGSPIGTIHYMSPEQTRGEQLDQRTDIFSLGSVLYEAATGKTPFHGASVLTVLHEIATEPQEFPSKLDPSIPKGFDEIISHAMAKNAEDRFQSATEFHEALKKLKLDLSSPQVQRPEQIRREPSKKTTPGSNAKIFLVEDNDDNRDMLSRRLTRKGFEVSFAVNGRDALDRIPVEKPDLILMDISLPVIDGIEVSRRLKNSDGTKQIPIIALTAHAMAGDREKALAAGCDDYDTKPVDFERLMSKILHWLEKK
jgi:serine/threonine protein kinase